MPPEALQAPISEEEASYRKELHERLAKLSDEVPESEKKKRPEKYRKGLSGALQNGGRFRDKSSAFFEMQPLRRECGLRGFAHSRCEKGDRMRC